MTTITTGANFAGACKGWLKKYAKAVKAQSVSIAQIIGSVLAVALSLIFDNTGDADGSLHTLPEASTAIGCYYTFVLTAAQQIVVELDNADQFLHLTLDAGDQIQSSTIGDSITVMAVDATNWVVLSCYPASTDWADGGA